MFSIGRVLLIRFKGCLSTFSIGISLCRWWRVRARSHEGDGQHLIILARAHPSISKGVQYQHQAISDPVLGIALMGNDDIVVDIDRQMQAFGGPTEKNTSRQIGSILPGDQWLTMAL